MDIEFKETDEGLRVPRPMELYELEDRRPPREVFMRLPEERLTSLCVEAADPDQYVSLCLYGERAGMLCTGDRSGKRRILRQVEPLKLAPFPGC
jgi:hypothetical protein